jgi:hypothetical protein
MTGPRWSARTAGRFAGWLAIAAALGFLGNQLWQSDPWGLAGARAPELGIAIGVGTLAYALASFLLAEAWRHLLGPGPAEVYPRHHRALYGRTQIAKYLPGNCFHFVGRHVLGRRLGHPHGTLALASVVEAGLLVLVAGAIALPLVWYRLEKTLGAPGWLLLATAGVPLTAIVLSRRRIREWWVRAAPGARGRVRAWAMHLLQAALLQAAFFIVLGLILWSLAAAIQAPGAHAIAPTIAISTLAMAWLAGFVVPGSPAGVGVREAVLALTLEPYLMTDGAVLLAFALRLITTLGDLLFFVMCSLIRCDAPLEPVASVQPGWELK